jgi:hypothetical protein
MRIIITMRLQWIGCIDEAFHWTAQPMSPRMIVSNVARSIYWMDVLPVFSRI